MVDNSISIATKKVEGNCMKMKKERKVALVLVSMQGRKRND